MRFRRNIKLEDTLSQICLLPLINVLFLLFIFFMLMPALMINPGLRIDLPKAVTSQAISPQNIEIMLSAENIIYLNGKAVGENELRSLLQEVAKRKKSVLIKSDRRASLGKAVEIWDMCRSLGVAQVNVATNQ